MRVYIFIAMLLMNAPVFAATAGNGDLTGDGLTTRSDLSLLGDYLLGKNDLNTSQSARADMNADSSVDIADAVRMVSDMKGFIAINVTPDVTSWTLTGPVGFAAVSGVGDRSGTGTLVITVAGNYVLHCNPMKQYSPPADKLLPVEIGDAVVFDARCDFVPVRNDVIDMIDMPFGGFYLGNCGRGDDYVYGDKTEKPQCWVAVQPHQIGKYEITNGQFIRVMNWAHSKGYLKNSTGGAYTGGDIYARGWQLTKFIDSSGHEYSDIVFSGGKFSCKTRTGAGGVRYSMESHPVSHVTWYGAVAFCNWLSDIEGKTRAYNMTTWTLVDTSSSLPQVQFTNGYRLPVESEWERAAAWDGTTHWIYAYTSDVSLISLRSNVRCWNPLGLEVPYTTPVGWFNGVNVSPANGLKTVDSHSPAGCYDMSGNIQEWCHDYADPGYGYGGTSSIGPVQGYYRRIRGGNWRGHYEFSRTADRQYEVPTWSSYDYGFRVARTP